MSDFLILIKRIGVLRKYIFLLMLRAPFDAIRTWMLAGLMKTTFLCLEIKDMDKLLSVCIFYGLICALLFFYNGTVWSVYAAFAAKMEAQVQKLMMESMLKLPLRRVESHRSGEWFTRLNSDVQTAFMMMNGPLNIPHGVVAIINTLMSTLLLLGSNRHLFVVTWVLVLPHLLVNHKLVLRHMQKLKAESQKAMAESTFAIKPLITEAETILLYDAGDLMMQKCEESSLKLMRIHMSMHIRNVLSNLIMRLFGSGGYFALLLIGYSLIGNGKMVFADVVYCSQVRGSILAGVFMLITCLGNIRANTVCVKRINDVFEE